MPIYREIGFNDLSKVEGFEELRHKIMQLSDDKKKRASMLRILRVQARDLRDAARAKVPVKSGNLRWSIGVITSKKKDYPNVLIGPRASAKWKGYHGHLIEKGFYNKRVKRHIPAQPFMRPAFEQEKGQVSEKTAAQVAKAIQREIDRLSR